MILSIIRKPGPIQLPGSNTTGNGSSTTGNTGTCTTYPCPDVLVPGYNNNGNDGGTALPTSGSPVITPANTQVGTGMDMEAATTSTWSEIGSMLVPGVAFAVLIFILISASKK